MRTALKICLLSTVLFVVGSFIQLQFTGSPFSNYLYTAGIICLLVAVGVAVFQDTRHHPA